MIEVVEEVVTVDITEEVIVVEMGDAVPLEWGRITGLLSDQEDLNGALNRKADRYHVHDDRYYTEAESDALLAGKADVVHVHDDRYYMRTESDAALAGKQNVLMFDAVPAAGSENPVYSGGVYDGLADAAATGSASGGMVSVPDGAGAAAAGLTVGIEPVQDLHGYGHPWPGGAGKNLADPSKLYLFSSGTYIATNNYNTAGAIPVSENTQYVITAVTDGSDKRVIFWDADGIEITPRVSTNIFRTPSGCKKISFYRNLTSAVTSVDNAKVQIEKGASATAYEPYSNICPITGWDDCNVYSTGKNLIECVIEHALGMYNQDTQLRLVSGEGTCLKFGCKAGVTYAVSGCPDRNRVLAAIFDSDPNVYDVGTREAVTATVFGFTFTASKTGVCLAYVANSIIDTSTAIVELGSIAAAYEPYNGQTVTIDLGGTRYGGTLDVTTGVLTVTKVYWTRNTSTMNNSENYPGWNNAGIRSILPAGVSGAMTGTISNISPVVKDEAGKNYFAFNTIGSNNIIYLPRSVWNNKSQTEWIADAIDIELVIPLAAPQICQLTPAEVTIIPGECHVWADTGDVLDLTYWRPAGAGIAEGVGNAARNAGLADGMTRAMITENIEVSMTASRNYVTGNLLIVGSRLFKATQNIADGGTIVEGTNVSGITLAQYILDVLH